MLLWPDPLDDIAISFALLNYFLLYKKYCLFKMGLSVNWFFQYSSDYQRLKALIDAENDADLKKK
jgi:hypothetical protein